MTASSIWTIRWINFFSMILGAAFICFGIWMSTQHDDCRKTLMLPALFLGGVILVISFIGFLGSWKKVTLLLWVYLFLLFAILAGILACTIIGFIMTNNKTGHDVSGLRYKEYHLEDYNSWIIKQLDGSANWKHLRSCFVKPESCDNLPKIYKNLEEFKLAELSPIEAGCCIPPSACGYPIVNVSRYDLNHHSKSKNKDCDIYKNVQNIKCFECDACKAGVIQYMRTKWKIIAIINIVIFVGLLFIFFIGCSARSKVMRSRVEG